ncbi:MAG: Holliday junction branch migration protein RuvA [Propionibacteriaceae bacterium]|nr:Holliday junction branch migration protein RuvA [Propionibacteriaceae bacterium]
MISQLTGTVVAAGAAGFVIDVGGVGFKGHCTPGAAAALRPGETSTIFTSLIVREDSLTLYGFSSDAEREVFELVQSASGVGPKVALAICSVLPPAELKRAVLTEDLKALCRVPGIGNKSAQKLVLELRDKAGLLALDDAAAQPVAAVTASELWREQVSDGLQGLGWSAREAATACDAVAELAADGATVAQLMRAALGALGKR